MRKEITSINSINMINKSLKDLISLDQNAHKLKELVLKYYEVNEAGTAIEQQLEEDPENFFLENEFDRLYKVEFKVFAEIRDILSKISNGAITHEIANRLLTTKKQEVLDLVNKLK